MSLEYQDALLKDIHKDLLLTNTNLKDAGTEVKSQGIQMNNISGQLKDANQTIKNIDRTEKVTEMRERIYRCSLYFIALMEFITIIVLLLVKLFK